MFGTNEIVGKKFFSKAPQDSLLVTSIFFTLQGEGPFMGQPAAFVRLAKCNLNCHFCFDASTLITIENGVERPISEISPGDVVLSWNEDTSTFERKKVTKVYLSLASEMCRVYTTHTLPNGSVSRKIVDCTPEHLFLTKDGWMQAEGLTHERPLEWYGQEVKVNGTELLHLKKEKVVYNLEVEDNHTYIANNCVVHNCDTYFDNGDWMSFDEILQTVDHKVDEFFNYTPPIWAEKRQHGIVLTGGEPSLQENAARFLQLCAKGTDDDLTRKEYGGTRLITIKTQPFAWTQIESNGISVLEAPYTTLVVSPKCREKDGRAVEYLKPNKEMLARAACLKFVMCHPDLSEQYGPYTSIPDWALEWRENTGNMVYVSPMNIYNKEPEKAKILKLTDPDAKLDVRSEANERISFWEPGLLDLEANRKNHEWTALYAMKHNLRLNIQMHLLANLP